MVGISVTQPLCFHIVPFKKLPNLSVNVSFDCECSPHELDIVRCLTPSHAKEGMELLPAAIAYATFMMVQEKLVGTAQAISKSKTDHVQLVCTGNKLSITWATQGSLSALRKSLSLAMAGLHPLKTFPRVKALMKDAGVKLPDRDSFDKHAAGLTHSIQSTLCTFVVGRISLQDDKEGKEKILGMLETVKKYRVLEGAKKSTHSPATKSAANADSASLKFSSHMAAALAHEYVSITLGRKPRAVGKALEFGELAESARAKLGDKDRIAAYIKAKYERFDANELTCYLAYYAIANAVTDASTLSEFASKNPKDAIKAALNQL